MHNALRLEAGYRPRPIRFLHLADLDGWRVKVYGISAHGECPDPGFVQAAEHVARRQLPNPPIWSAVAGEEAFLSADRYGVALLIAHEGREAGFALVSWWVGENMLQHHVYVAAGDDPVAFEYLSPAGVVACVWELAVLAFERQAWVDTVLANPAGPDLDAYLASRLSAEL
jgi:hypothetical protein